MLSREFYAPICAFLNQMSSGNDPFDQVLSLFVFSLYFILATEKSIFQDHVEQILQ